MMRFTVSNVLFDAHIQLQFLEKVHSILLNCHDDAPDTIPLIGESRDFAADNPPTRKKKIKLDQNTTSALMKTPNTSSKSQDVFQTAATHFDWLIKHQSRSPMQLTWGVLTALYISDYFKDIVCADTPPKLAHAYLKMFDARIETYLCGNLHHNKSDKSRKLLCQSKTPSEIVLCEWLLVKQLYTTASMHI